MTITGGGHYVAAVLREEGVESAFGIVDGSYLQLCKGIVTRGIRLITPRHESSGVHMAGAHARLTGKLGVCLASNGPGVANVLSGAVVESGEGNRVLLITSCRRTGIQYPDRGGTFQRFDQVGTLGALGKWACQVHSPDQLGEVLRKALRACWEGRPMGTTPTIRRGCVRTIPCGATSSSRTRTTSARWRRCSPAGG